MAKCKPARGARAFKVEPPFPQVHFDIPYFAHMYLDPKTYPKNVGLPVCELVYAPPENEDGVWEGSNEEFRGSDNDELSGILDFDETLDPFTPAHDKPETSPKPVKESTKRAAESSSTAYNKKQKYHGGRPAAAKPVKYDLDSDDELIVRMKQARYLEKDIADRLAAEGRTIYAPKSIGTRWARIKQVLQTKQDDLLDEDMSDWHDGDDEALMQAIAKADRDVEKAKQQAEAKKWKLVADEMMNLKPVTHFSQHACQARYYGLVDGTAKPTPESIEEPDEKTLRKIQARRDKEEQIRSMREHGVDQVKQNLVNNGWTSRMRQG